MARCQLGLKNYSLGPTSTANFASVKITNLKGNAANYIRPYAINVDVSGVSGANAVLVPSYISEGTNLSSSDFSSQDLRDLDLSGYNFMNANLSNANLSGANLSNANLVGLT